MEKTVFTSAAIAFAVTAWGFAAAAPPPQQPSDQNVPQDVGKAPLPPSMPDAVQEKDGPTPSNHGTVSNQLGVPRVGLPSEKAAPAQNPGALPNKQVAALPGERMMQYGVKSALGAKVLDASGGEVGSVDDLIIDQDGRLAAIVVKSGGFLGIGGKDTAVAADKAHISADRSGEIVQLEISKGDLMSAPEFKTQDDLKSDLGSKSDGSE